MSRDESRSASGTANAAISPSVFQYPIGSCSRARRPSSSANTFTTSDHETSSATSPASTSANRRRSTNSPSARNARETKVRLKKSHERSGASDQRIEARLQSANAAEQREADHARPRQHRPRQQPPERARQGQRGRADDRPDAHPEEPSLAEDESRRQQNPEGGEDCVAAAPHAATLPGAYKATTSVLLAASPRAGTLKSRGPAHLHACRNALDDARARRPALYDPDAETPPPHDRPRRPLSPSCRRPPRRPTCWQELVNDYWADNRVDRPYPISCYREAMSEAAERRAGVLRRAGRPAPRPARRDPRRARLNERLRGTSSRTKAAQPPRRRPTATTAATRASSRRCSTARPEERRLDPRAPPGARLDRAPPHGRSRRELPNAVPTRRAAWTSPTAPPS